METKIIIIKCPHCEVEINVDENLAAILDKKYKKDYLDQLKVQQQAFEKIEADLKTRAEYLESLKAELTELYEKVEKQVFSKENKIVLENIEKISE